MQLAQELLATGLVLALIALAAVAAHRRGWLRLHLPIHSHHLRQFQLVDRFALTPHHQLHLIRFENQILLVATHPRGIEVVESQVALKTTRSSEGGK